MKLDGIDPVLLSSRRVFPFEVQESTFKPKAQLPRYKFNSKSMVSHMTSTNLNRFRQHESSTVVSKPLEMMNQRRRSVVRMHQPLMSIVSVDARDKVQKKKLDDLLLSHVDTLTRSGSSKTLLP